MVCPSFTALRKGKVIILSVRNVKTNLTAISGQKNKRKLIKANN